MLLWFRIRCFLFPGLCCCAAESRAGFTCCYRCLLHSPSRAGEVPPLSVRDNCVAVPVPPPLLCSCSSPASCKVLRLIVFLLHSVPPRTARPGQYYCDAITPGSSAAASGLQVQYCVIWKHAKAHLTGASCTIGRWTDRCVRVCVCACLCECV